MYILFSQTRKLECVGLFLFSKEKTDTQKTSQGHTARTKSSIMWYIRVLFISNHADLVNGPEVCDPAKECSLSSRSLEPRGQEELPKGMPPK